ncbi:nuclear transport factor 2 family protein [Emticicia aquatilis]|nr:nuclear transport factor 2 family protein [Emticicia aquatilis]
MKRFITLLLPIIIFNTSIPYSQTSLKVKGLMEIEINKSEILDVTRQLKQLMIDKNLVELNKILDSHFTLTHITGYVQSKEEWFSEIESERMKYYSYKEVKNTIKIEDDKATFVSQNLFDARIWGSRNTWRLQQIMQLEKRKDKWIILKSVATTF